GPCGCRGPEGGPRRRGPWRPAADRGGARSAGRRIGPSAECLRGEPAVPIERRDRGPYRTRRAAGRLRGGSLPLAGRPRSRGHEGLGPTHERPVRGEGGSPRLGVFGPGARRAGSEGQRPLRGAPGDARIPCQPDPAGGGRLRGRVRTRGVLRNPEEELRRLVVQAFLSPPKTAVGRAPREGRRRPVRGHGGRAAGVAGRPGPVGPNAAVAPDLKIVIRARRSLPMACQFASTGRYI